MSNKRTCSECGKPIHRQNTSGLCRSHRMRALHADPEFARAHAERMRALNADPEFAKAHAERGAKRMRALHADPEFAKANAKRMRALHADPEFNPLASLTTKERAAYDILKRKGYSRRDALAAIGRDDLNAAKGSK